MQWLEREKASRKKRGKESCLVLSEWRRVSHWPPEPAGGRACLTAATDASAAIALPEGLSPCRLHTGALTHVQFVDGSRMEKVFSDSFNDDKVSNYLRSSISD